MVTLGHAGEDGQVQLKRTFAGVEDATEVVAHLVRDIPTAISLIRYMSTSGRIWAKRGAGNLRSLIRGADRQDHLTASRRQSWRVW